MQKLSITVHRTTVSRELFFLLLATDLQINHDTCDVSCELYYILDLLLSSVFLLRAQCVNL